MQTKSSNKAVGKSKKKTTKKTTKKSEVKKTKNEIVNEQAAKRKKAQIAEAVKKRYGQENRGVI